MITSLMIRDEWVLITFSTGTNTYLFMAPEATSNTNTAATAAARQCLLLDTGQGPEFPIWRQSLRKVLENETETEPGEVGRRLSVTKCVLSHWHGDHVGGLGELLEVCEEMITGSRDDMPADGGGLEIYKFPLYDSDAPSVADQGTIPDREKDKTLLASAVNGKDPLPIRDLHDGQILTVGGTRSQSQNRDEDDANSDSNTDSHALKLRVLHTPGHTADHIALIIVSSPADPTEVGTIFTGDAVLGHGTSVFEDLATYLASLAKMKAAIEQIESTARSLAGRKTRAFPAHGAPIQDAKAKIDEYIAHRALRERQILDVLRHAAGADGSGGTASTSLEEGTVDAIVDDDDDGQPSRTPMQIVREIYKEVSESLYGAAEAGVIQVLEKLEAEGRVERVDRRSDGKGRWRIVSQD
jgi:endoribonuclease LACTB2